MICLPVYCQDSLLQMAIKNVFGGFVLDVLVQKFIMNIYHTDCIASEPAQL